MSQHNGTHIPNGVNGHESRDSNGTESVRVKLQTATAYRLPEAQFMLPAHFGPAQLTQVINKSLSLVDAVDFDFIINGQIWRASLGAWLKSQGQSTEQVLEVEYLEKFQPPSSQATLPHPAWVSAVAFQNPASSSNVLASATFDGSFHLWNDGQELTSVPEAHSLAVSSVCAIDGQTWATASYDRTAKIWRMDSESNLQCTSILSLHQDCLSSVASSSSGQNLTAGWDGIIGFFDSTEASSHETEELPALTDGKKKKKRRTATSEAFRKAPLQVLSNHQGRVSRANFWTQQTTKAYSAGWDRTVRTWDLTSGINLATRQSASVIRDIVELQDGTTILATAHTDRSICIWDLRSQERNVESTVGEAHQSHVVSLAAHPHSATHLASAGLDGTVKVWDTRITKTALFELPQDDSGAVNKKIFSIDWNASTVAAGGEKKEVKLWNCSIAATT